MTKDLHQSELKLDNHVSPKHKTHRSRKKKYHNFPWFDEPYNIARGETALWVAVITQAMMDALSRSRNAEAIYQKHEAIRWLTGNGRDFIQVCLFAGMDPGYVRRKAKRSLVAPIAWRSAPGKGKRYLERKAYRQRLKKKISEKKELESSPEPFRRVIVGPW